MNEKKRKEKKEEQDTKLHPSVTDMKRKKRGDKKRPRDDAWKGRKRRNMMKMTNGRRKEIQRNTNQSKAKKNKGIPSLDDMGRLPEKIDVRDGVSKVHEQCPAVLAGGDDAPVIRLRRQDPASRPVGELV